MKKYENPRDIKSRGLLFIGDGSDLSLSVVRALASRNVEPVHEVTLRPQSPVVSKYSRHLESYKRIPERIEYLTPAVLIEHARKKNVRVLLPITAEAVTWVVEHVDDLETYFLLPPLVSRDSLEKTSDKWLLHNWLKQNQLKSPQTLQLGELEDLSASAFSGMRYPLIIKSRSERPFKQIFSAASPDDLMRVLGNLERDPDCYIVQEYIEGIDVDCSFLAKDGKVIAHTTQTPVVARQLRFASSIKVYRDSRVLEMVENIVSMLNWNGVAHLDFRYSPSDDDYYLIDFNARYWTTLLGSVCAGINVPFLQYRQAIQQEIDTPESSDITFMLNRDAVRELARRALGNSADSNGFSWRDTELLFSLQDPVPEIFRFARSGIRKLKSVFGISDLPT